MSSSITQLASPTPLARNWRRERINRELRQAGTSQFEQSQKIGCSHSLVSLVISGKAVSLPCATSIAAALGRAPWEIWPRIYAAPAMPTGDATTAPNPTALAS